MPPLDWQGAMDILDPNRTPAALLDEGNVAAVMDEMPSPPTRPEPVQGSVPATDPADVPAAPKTKAAKAIQSAGADQPLCSSHGMKTIYAGKHWHCRK